MSKIIVDTLALNQMLNFQTILSCLLIYTLLFWGTICTWVYFDALKRYGSKNISFLIAVLVFIFSFPALILYLVLRKEEEEHSPSLEIENMHVTSIPIAELTQDGEIKFKLEVSIVPVSGVNKLQESESAPVKFLLDNKNNENINPTEENIKFKLIKYMNESSNSTSEIDKRIKKSINKLLKLIKHSEGKPRLN